MCASFTETTLEILCSRVHQVHHANLYKYHLNLFLCYQKQFEPVAVMLLLGTGISDVNSMSWCHCILQNELYSLSKTQIYRTLLVSLLFFVRIFFEHCILIIITQRHTRDTMVHELGYVYLTM